MAWRWEGEGEKYSSGSLIMSRNGAPEIPASEILKSATLGLSPLAAAMTSPGFS